MFYKIPGNNFLEINRELEIKRVDGLAITSSDFTIPENAADKIEIEISNVKISIGRGKLFLISYFGLLLPEEFTCFLDRYVFIKQTKKQMLARLDEDGKQKDLSNILDYEITFKHPIYINKRYRLIPAFPKYMMDKSGNIVNIETGKSIAPYVSDKFKKENKHYPGVYLQKEGFFTKAYKLHRLVASVWVENDNWDEKQFVNHKDGNKTNWHSSNLEWVSHSENNKHAVDNKLREDNVPVKMRDSLNGNESIHNSIADAFLFIGARQRSAMHALLQRNNGLYIYKERYEIRYLSDKTDFLSKTKDIGEIVNSLKIGSIDYEMKNIKTGTIHSGIAARLSKITGIAGVLIGRSAFRKTIIKDWMIRKKKNDNPEWNVDDYIVPRNTPIFIEALDPLTNKVMHVFASARKAGEGLGVKDKKTVQKRMLAGKLVGGFLLRRQAA